MISFENTEIAFKSKTDNDLKKAYWLFKIVGNKHIGFLWKMGDKNSIFVASTNKWYY